MVEAADPYGRGADRFATSCKVVVQCKKCSVEVAVVRLVMTFLSVSTTAVFGAVW